MKPYVVIMLILAMLIQNLSKAVIMADFYINREDIARELCENRNNPQEHCEGHCQLKKELEKKNSRDIPEILKEVPVYLKSDAYVSPQFSVALSDKKHLVHNDNRIISCARSIYHPPA